MKFSATASKNRVKLNLDRGDRGVAGIAVMPYSYRSVLNSKGYRNILKDGDLFITKNLLSKYNIYELIDL